jgi:ABC-type sulfate transport system permease subunit
MKELYNKLNKEVDKEIALSILIAIPAFIFMFGYGLIGEYFKAKSELDMAVMFSWGGILLAMMWLLLSAILYVGVEFIHALADKIFD